MSELYTFSKPGLWVNHKLDAHPEQGILYMHAHDMLEVYFLLSGNVVFSVEGNAYYPEPDDIMIVRSAETHKITTNPGAPYERITVHIAPTYLARYCPEYKELLSPFYQRKLGTCNQIHGRQFRSGHWRECLLSIAANARESFCEELYIDFNLLSFLAELQLAFGRWGQSGEMGRHSEHTARIVEYINAALFEPISVQSIGAQFHISPTHLNRIFHKATGSSVWNYILVKRLIAAREKICAGVPALSASAACGFGDYSAFYRAYRRMFGTSPQEDCRKLKG